MNKIRVFIGMTIMLAISLLSSTLNNVNAFEEIMIENRWWHAIRVIKVVLDGNHFVVSSIADEWGETIQSLTKKVWWISAINWAFFCPKDYANCDTTFSYYERVFKWDGDGYSMFWPDTSIRAIFWFTKEWSPLLVQNKISDTDVWLESNINADKLWDLYFWISNFPVLLIEWEDVTAWASKYIDSKLTWRWNRNFICSTEDETTIYMWIIWSIWVRDMASYLKENFGCYNALFLDAWASEAMVYSGFVLDQWSRKLITDAFVVVDRDSFIELWWHPNSFAKKNTKKYELTKSDINKVNQWKKLIEAVYEKYGKTWYKTKLIQMVRNAVTRETNPSKKNIYNQVLIYLFTIEEL